MKRRIVFVTGFSVLVLMACTAGPNPLVAQEPLAGFWKGLWHGFIMMFTFIISLFNDSVSMYEVNNNGNWYNFGFLFGAMMFWGGGGNQACSRSRPDKADQMIRNLKEEMRDEVVSEITTKMKEDQEKEETS